MARFWRVCVLMLSTFLLFESQAASIPAEEESSSSAIDFDTGYLIVAPKIFVAGSVETVCISLQNMTGPLEVAIRLMDNFTAMAKLPIQFMEFKMACYDIEVPSIEYEMMHATLLVKLRRTLVTQSGFEVVEKRMVTINAVNTEMFIETDKPVYKPGQTVKFRILNINQDLKPDVTPVSKIWIESPSGVKMQQWRNQESTDGLIDLELPMTNDPVTGTWSIIALHKDRKSTRTFEVDEYVLPKFEVIITPPTYVMINTTSIRVKVCGRYTYGQPVRGSFVARITVKSTGWNFRERKTMTRRVEDTGPSGCNEFPVDLSRLELNSTDFSLWDARLSVDVEYTETSTGVMLEANSESSQITRDALKLQFESPNIFKPGVPYYGKIFVTHPDGSPAAGKLISLSCNTDQGQIFDKNLTSPENGAIEFTVTDINITATSLNLYAHAPGFNIAPRETYGRQHSYTLHDPATSHYARPQFSPSGSFLQIAPIRGVAAVGSEQTLRIDFTANDPEENPRFRFVVMSRGNIIATRFYRAHKRPKRQAEGSVGSSAGSGPSQSEPDGSEDGMPSVVGEPSVVGLPSDMGSLDIPSFIPSVLGGSSFSSDFSFVPPTDAPVIIVEPGEVYSRELLFRVTPDMVPETRVLAYYIRTDGEVVADSVAFRVQKKFENEVDIAFSDEEMMPGAETQLMIHASPGSLCAVGVVDRSVHILGGDNQLKADKIFASLDKYQLTSAGGYIDATTHCVPEEDEYPQFFPLGRKKRGIFLPGYGSKYQDSSRAFKDMGLLFITNMDVETSPCVGVGSVSRGTAEVENAAEGPIAVPLLNKENAIFDDGGVLEKPDVHNDVLETAPRIRSYFPETWLWDLRRTDSVTGETSITMEVPDTVTEWIGSGFCTSVEYGVGVSPPTKLRAFQPFFLSYTLPYSVVRGEVVPITVTVFNYLTESLVVEVSLELTEGFRMARKSRPRKKVCVGGSQSQSVEFRIQPRKLGNIALQALGLSVNDQDALCGNELVSSSVGARDSIYKELLVEAEGTEVETTQNCYFCPEEVTEGEYERVFNVTLPDGIVEGSARGKVSITGDLMGPSLSNLDHLIRLPTGCGEQNMLGFVPNIVALSYLTTTDQLTPSVENKAKFNMKRGYQRELNYRHRDGSYSAFGENDPEGSTWLTAFVVRSFAQASDYIYIDKDDLKVSISWLKRLQNPDGCFESRGKLCHKDMKGGVNSERTLTSYVLISLLEAGLNLQNPVVSDALECVTKDLPEVEDTYTLAQLAYALTLAQSPLAQDVMDKLETKAVHEDGLTYWQTNRAKPNGTLNLYANQAPSTDIEMTSYVLLALIGRTTDITQALREGNPIARWIILQRNSNGGFSSTQDTVVALQALAEFAKVAYSEGTSIKAFVEFTPLDDEGSGEVFPFTITTLNRLVLEEETLPSLPAQVTLYASGAGCALLQISTIHNEIPESPEDAGFELDVLVLESYESSKNTRCTDYYMKVCARYTGSDEESNMAIIEVKMISGFYPDKESLRLLQKQHKPLQRYEVDNKNIYFYFNELTNEDTCLVFSIIKEIDVEDAKPGVVQVFDYYDKEINVKQLYDITCQDAPPSWDASLLYTIPVKPSEGESFGNAGDMRPLPFVLAALRRVDGLVFIDPPEGSEGAGTGGGAGGSDVDGGEENVQVDEVDPMDVARELGPPDVYILCPAGQKFVDGLKRCIPINGCESSPCLEGQNCIDTDAGHLCVGCKPGYRKGVADQCVRMPDPGLNQILCGPGQEYINGGCTTVDQCVDNPCPVDARCRSTAFGHTCEPVVCPPGRRLTNDLQCVDIDECLRNPCYEGEVCRNRALGYDCICAEGYERDASINVCVDINECETEIEPCGGPEYICMNDKGSYQCFCVEGYVMDNDGYCIVEVQEPANATRAPQRIGLETTSVPSPQNVTEQTASEIPQEGSEQFTEQPQGEVTQNATSQPSKPSPVEENTVTPSAGEETSDAGSSGNSSVAPALTEVASNASEESVSQSPGNVSSTENVTESTAAPESGSVTSRHDSSGTAAPDTQGNTTTTSPVEEVTSNSGAMRTNGTESPSVGNGSFVTPSAEEGSTQSQNESTTTSAPAEPDTSLNSSVTPVAVQETNTTAGEEAVTPSSGDTLGNTTVAPIRVTDSQSNATNAPLDATGAPSNTTEAPSNTTEAPSNATEAPSIASDAPGNATVAPIRVTDSQSNATEAPSNTTEVPGGEGGGPDEDKPIIDYGGIKPGTCPVEETGGFSICGGVPCLGDEDCSGTQKCCQRSCGKLCMAVGMQVDPIDPLVDIGGPVDVEAHPGVCPMDVGGSPWCTGLTCNHDGDCAGNEKCCFDFECGAESRCMAAPQIQPVPGPFGPFPVGPKPVVGPETRSGACPDEIGATPFCGGPLCIYDGECDPGEKCCSSATCGEGLSCMPAPQIQPVPPMKPREGSCPMMGNCQGQECVMDGDCFDNEKCCGSDCGYRCSLSLSLLEPPPLPELHLGLCPPVEGEGTCGATVCVQDGNCTMSEKCCVSACGFHCTPAIPFAPPAPIEPLVCPGDRVYLECNSACPEFCGQSLEIALCIQMCEPGCGCPEGTIHLSENSDECVASDACPVPVPISIQCTEPLVFNECGSACEQTCEKPELQPCTRQCVPGCFCPYGTLRVSLESDLCVSIMLDAPIDLNCPVAPPAPIEPLVCPGDRVYLECNSACPEFCGQSLEIALCIQMCEPGCGCPEGTIHLSENSDECVAPDACPVPAPTPVPISILIQCTEPLVFNECGSACEQTCEKPELQPCTRQCVPGCFCPYGTLRVSLESDLCVSIMLDAPIDLNCPVAEPRPCETERRIKLEERGEAEGVFIPQCTQDGFYAMEQCYEGNGTYCWCADPQTGTVLPDSEVHGARADCDRFIPDPSLLNQCPEGKVFADGVKKCVYPEPEPRQPGIPACPGDFVQNDCNSACPEYCGQPEEVGCIQMCMVGCGCPSGKVKASLDSNMCVAPEDCAAGVPEPEPEPLTCVNNLVHKDCGTACPLTCNEKEAEMCVAMCVAGCHCPDGMYLVPGDSPRCVAQEECPEPCDEGYKYNEDLECVVANPCHVLLAAVQARMPMPGQFTPTCTSEGKYETVQCHGSTGFCWCADTETGVKKQGTDVRGTPDCPEPAPTCDEGYKHNEDLECVVANPCHVLLAAVQMADERMVGQFTPMCTSEGKYETVQCHGSTGFCWCADTETGVKKQGTDVRGTPDCTAPVPTCEGEMEFQTCGSACPAVCNEPEQICIFQCVRECQCPSGTLLVREDPPRCVAFEECPSPCDNGMKFSECGQDCQDYCGRPEEGFCNSVCKPGCVCPEGTIRIDLETDMCVPREDCPGLEIPVEIEVEFGGVGPALIFVDCSGSNPCLNGGTCESEACTCLEGFSGDLCDTFSAVGPALSFVDCSGSNPCLNGGVCENLACTCAPGFSGDLCDSVVCPMVTATTPDDVGQIRTIICDFDHIFIVKMRLDGRAKILNDLTTSVNPYASERPIFGFISNDVCNVELTEERYILFMAGEAVNMPGKKFTLDHTVLAMPMTGHIKNEIHELCSVA
ncbi:uncharacterized protein LOC757285 isoform X4 [Strongylocentrotus purpuratus]|uniref:Alpha-2-macroglobulin n=1 Tax=Strongylocentrotus purpuratus TaxID=7668 RepID=A0A7M7N8U2_STRPU|nr:uncharacterized protein LOC757285 isoform X4 [Strongylocentrotus purpuratus]